MTASTPPDPERRPLSFLAAASWTLVVAITVGVAVAIIDAVHPGAFDDVVTIAACKVLAYSLALFGLLRMHDPTASIRAFVGLRRPPFLVALLALVAGAGLAPGAMWLNELFARRFPATPEETQQLEHVFGAETLGKKVALVVALVVIMPVADELFFRGALFTPLKRGRRAHIVILATAAYDTLLGGVSPRVLASMLATSLVIAWIRAVSGSVVPSVLARVGFFAVQIVPLVLVADDRLSGRVVLAATALALAAIGGLAVATRRSPGTMEARLQDG
ncbi:MAG: hypothetical protein JWP97_3609 [Labilithrix sp.]|nr:hypothetical protein [Labilithrix sp.]